MAEEVDVKLVIDTADSATSVSEIRKSIRDLKSAMNEVGEGSADFNKLAAAAGQLKEKMDLTNKSVAALANNGTKFAALAGGAKQIASGFEGAVAASILFGEKNEELEKSLLKVQAAASLTRAIGELSELGKTAQVVATVMKSAFATNPLGVILVAITAVIAAAALLINSFDDEKKASEELTRALSKQKDALENLNEVNEADTSFLKSRLALLKKQKASTADIQATEAQIFKQQQQSLNQKKQLIEVNKKLAIEDAKFGKNKITDEKELQDKLKQIQDKADADQTVASNQIAALSEDRKGEVIDDAREAAEEEKKIRDKAAEDYKTFIKKGLDDLTKSNENKVLQTKENSQERVDVENTGLDAILAYSKKNYKALGLDQTELLNLELKNTDQKKKNQEGYQKYLKDIADKEAAALKARQQAEIDAIDNSYKLKAKELEDAVKTDKKILDSRTSTEKMKLDALRQSGEDENKILQNNADKEIAIANKIAADRIAASDGSAAAIQSINDKLQETILKVTTDTNAAIAVNTEENDNQVTELKEKNAEKYLGYASQLSGSLQDLSDIVFSHEEANGKLTAEAKEKLARKQFNVNKGLQLGSAAINAAQAVISSLAQSPVAIGPIPNPAGIASLALVAISGAASIAKIAATQFQPDATTATVAASPRVSIPSIPSTPAVSSSISGGSGGSSANSTGFTPSSLFGLGQGARVYGSQQGTTTVQVSVHDINRAQNKVQVINQRSTLSK